jgi:hypothetical protein
MSNLETRPIREDDSQLQLEIIKLRRLIRYHRDQKGNDRSWLDDELLYESLPETASNIPVLATKEAFMEKCTRFFERRQAPSNTKQTLEETHAPSDEDIKEMTLGDQKKEIARLIQAIRLHRNIGDNKRSWQDDKRLYQALNENTTYDTKLPDKETFLNSCDKFFSTQCRPVKIT